MNDLTMCVCMFCPGRSRQDFWEEAGALQGQQSSLWPWLVQWVGSLPGHLTKELNISSRCNSFARDLPVLVLVLLLLLVMVHQIVVHLIPPGIAWILSLASDWPAWISCCRWREVSFQMQPLPAGSQVRKSTQITSFAKGCKQWQHSLRLSFESPDNADALLTFPRFGSAPNFCNAQANFPVYCQPVILVWFILSVRKKFGQI